MNGVPNADIQDIKRQLHKIQQEVGTIHSRFNSLEAGLEDKIELAMRRRMDVQGKQGREISGWVISLISFGLFIVFSLVSIAFQLWGS